MFSFAEVFSALRRQPLFAERLGAALMKTMSPPASDDDCPRVSNDRATDGSLLRTTYVVILRAGPIGLSRILFLLARAAFSGQFNCARHSFAIKTSVLRCGEGSEKEHTPCDERAIGGSSISWCVVETIVNVPLALLDQSQLTTFLEYLERFSWHVRSVALPTLSGLHS